MRINYQIFKEKSLLVLKAAGPYSIDHFKSFAEILVKDPEWKYVKKLLADYREANLDIAIDEVDRIIKIRKEIIIENIFVVFLVDKPLPTVAIHLFINNMPGYHNNYCSTMENALRMLGLNESEKEMEDILKNLIKSI